MQNAMFYPSSEAVAAVQPLVAILRDILASNLKDLAAFSDIRQITPAPENVKLSLSSVYGRIGVNTMFFTQPLILQAIQEDDALKHEFGNYANAVGQLEHLLTIDALDLTWAMAVEGLALKCKLVVQ